MKLLKFHVYKMLFIFNCSERFILISANHFVTSVCAVVHPNHIDVKNLSSAVVVVYSMLGNYSNSTYFMIPRSP